VESEHARRKDRTGLAAKRLLPLGTACRCLPSADGTEAGYKGCL